MLMMRHGFTMIELIFVIVVIGILASVAIPKLAATRDDAINTRVLANVKLCKEGVINAYAAKGTPLSTSKTEIVACQKDINGVPFVMRDGTDGNGYEGFITYKLTQNINLTETFRYAGNFVIY
jgi:prepilin-type N-terminal cleavage/methylation domain-containing protein